MRIKNDKGIKIKLAKAASAVFALVFGSVFCLSNIDPLTVNADTEIIISATTNQNFVGPGDVVIVDVIASKMPGVTEFGPIEISYDLDKAEYVSYDQGKETVGRYYINAQRKNDDIVFTGMDQNINSGNDGSADEDNAASFYSDEQVVLFSAAFRLATDVSGEVRFTFKSIGDFKAPDKKITARIGSGLTVPVRRTGLSSDATIASLKIRGTTLSPDFNPNITEYNCSVERSVTDVQVTVLSSNLWAAVEIGGNQHLNTGDNLVTIDVTAQNGINHMHYVVHVVRRESNIPENSSLVDLEGKTYTFLDPPEDAKVPDGFYPAMKIINGYSVPVFVKDGVSSVILFLYDGNESSLYFYNSSSKKVIKYEPDNLIIKESSLLRLAEVPAGVVLPDDFKPATFDTGSRIISGYENGDGDFICYLIDDDGSADFYYLDKTTGTISRYRFADKKAELLYSYLFDVFLVIAIIEAVIVTISVYIIRRMVSDRTNPRPKRV